MIPEPLRGALGSELGGTFYLSGDDSYRREEAARLLVEAHLDPATRDFNYDALRGSEVALEDLASVIATLPMMASFRVVLLREVEALASSSRARDLLTELAASPPEGLALILVSGKESGAAFYKKLKSSSRSIEFKPLAANDLPPWLMKWAEERCDVVLEEDAARALAAALGPDLALLAQEVEKLATLEGEGGRITVKTVEQAGTRLPKQDRWQWFDLVGERRFEEALRGLPILLQHGENGVGLTIGLTTHLLRLGLLMEGGENALASFLPHRQKWLVSRFRAQAKQWPEGSVTRALYGLRQVDQRLKSSPLSDAHHLECWILEQMAGAEAVA